MKKFCAFIAVILGLVMPSHATAGTQYSIDLAWTQEQPECEHAHLEPVGVALFNVNETPLPTYEVPGAFLTLPNGWETNVARAGFDSVLLRMGANTRIC